MRSLLTFLALLASLSAAAQTFVKEVQRGCQVQVRTVEQKEVFSWSGECKDGKADGPGVLTSSHGALLRGAYLRGETLDAAGWWPMRTSTGARKLWSVRYSKTNQYVSQYLLPAQHRHYSTVSGVILAGKWRLESFDGSCKEEHVYLTTGIEEATSNEERLLKAFAVLQSDTDPSDLALLSSVSISNGKPDCQNGVSREGESSLNALRAADPQTFNLCSIDEPSKCFAKLTRYGQ